MTPAQRRLARHALGLPNRYRRSYRNRYYTEAGHPDWCAMVAAGEAEAEWCRAGWMTLSTYFRLTLKGASAAIEAGEALDPEDFPASKPAAV